MICKNCGAEFSDGMFCPKCGVEIMPMHSFKVESQINAWKSAFDYYEGDEYNTKKYGPQGYLEEQHIIQGICINDGEKRVFESKILICETPYSNILACDNTELKFRNCTLVLGKETAIDIGSNVIINFENCLIKGNGQLVMGDRYDNFSTLEFRNCAFIGDGMFEKTDYLIAMCGRVYFENCFIKDIYIGTFYTIESKSEFLVQKVEFRDCVIINEFKDVKQSPNEDTVKSIFHVFMKESFKKTCIIKAEGAIELDFYNCYIRSKERFFETPSNLNGKNPRIKIDVKNSYFDDCSYFIKD